MTIFINDNIKRLVDFYGYDAQSRQGIEEMAELTQAINKFWRKQLKCGRAALEEADRDSSEVTNIIEEIADVLIVLTQLITVFDCVDEVEEVMEHKVNRQLERMEDCV